MASGDAAAALRRALHGLLEPAGPHPDERPGLPQAARLTPAAVLVPAVVENGRLQLLFTVRTAHLKSHPGQISFPGGHVERCDADVAHTAVREAEEELGIDRGDVATLGCLRPCITGTGYRVIPVVGLLRPGLRYAPDDYEVAEVFHAPLSHLLAAENRREETLELRGKPVTFPVIDYGSRRIWGATARMVVDLAELLHVNDRVGPLTPFLAP